MQMKNFFLLNFLFLKLEQKGKNYNHNYAIKQYKGSQFKYQNKLTRTVN